MKSKRSLGSLDAFQPPLLDAAVLREPPSTRYQGSKLKLLPWIWTNIRTLEFETALDVFGGTGSVSYLLKSQGKAITYNDYLHFNHFIGTALIENQGTRLSELDLDFLLHRDPRIAYENVIAKTFTNIYFTDDENAWLDTICQNIPRLADKYKKALAYFALFQACIAKRPYNLFHRQNLYMRTAEVARNFGNKATWDKPFERHFRNFIAECNHAIFDSGLHCEAICYEAIKVHGRYDLVYIDTPYINKAGVGVDYLDFYHFLEGMTDYHNWKGKIDYKRKHRPLKGERSAWSDRRTVLKAFKELFEKFADSILVVSYRSDGIPSEEDLIELLKTVKTDVSVVQYGAYKYVLSTNSESNELLLIGQ